MFLQRCDALTLVFSKMLSRCKTLCEAVSKRYSLKLLRAANQRFNCTCLTSTGVGWCARWLRAPAPAWMPARDSCGGSAGGPPIPDLSHIQDPLSFIGISRPTHLSQNRNEDVKQHKKLRATLRGAVFSRCLAQSVLADRTAHADLSAVKNLPLLDLRCGVGRCALLASGEKKKQKIGHAVFERRNISRSFTPREDCLRDLTCPED